MQILNLPQLIAAHEIFNEEAPTMFAGASLGSLEFIEFPQILTQPGESPSFKWMMQPDSITEPKTWDDLIDCGDLLAIMFSLCRSHPVDFVDGMMVWKRRDIRQAGGWVTASVIETVFFQLWKILEGWGDKRDAKVKNAIEKEMRARLKYYFAEILNEWRNQVLDEYPENEKADAAALVPETEVAKIKKKCKRPLLMRPRKSGTGVIF